MLPHGSTPFGEWVLSGDEVVIYSFNITKIGKVKNTVTDCRKVDYNAH